jgi:hypothetical protein
MLSAELVGGRGREVVKSSSTVGVHLAAIKALTRAGVMAGVVGGRNRRGERGNDFRGVYCLS